MPRSQLDPTPMAHSRVSCLRGPGTVALLASWGITLYTLRLLIELHECVPGVRFDRYRDLGVHALGPRLGLWVVVPLQLVVKVGCDVVYMVTGGKCLQKFVESVCAARRCTSPTGPASSAGPSSCSRSSPTWTPSRPCPSPARAEHAERRVRRRAGPVRVAHPAPGPARQAHAAHETVE
jgi:hypothetical protein